MLRRTKEGENRPSKREETGNCKNKQGRGNGWPESANNLSEDGMHAKAPPSSSKRSKKLKVVRHEETPQARRRSRTRNTIPASLQTPGNPLIAHYRMADIYKIATLNINALASQTRLAMLDDFMRKKEIDIFLQEVTQPMFDTIRGYAACTLIGTTRRGTTILTR